MTEQPTAAPELFRWPVRVYWEDTDAGGVVFYANYLKFFERGRTEWLRALGFSQETMKRDAGAIFVVSETAVQYLRPARLDDLLSISVALSDLGRASMELLQTARRDDCVLAQGRIRIGCVDAGTFRPKRIPSGVLAAAGRDLTPLHLPHSNAAS